MKIFKSDKLVNLNVEAQAFQRNLSRENEMQVNRKLFQKEAPTYARKHEEFDIRKH